MSSFADLGNIMLKIEFNRPNVYIGCYWSSSSTMEEILRFVSVLCFLSGLNYPAVCHEMLTLYFSSLNLIPVVAKSFLQDYLPSCFWCIFRLFSFTSSSRQAFIWLRWQQLDAFLKTLTDENEMIWFFYTQFEGLRSCSFLSPQWYKINWTMSKLYNCLSAH